MQKERKGKHFIKKPIYEGGLKAMRAFIQQHKTYPKAALENKIEGTVYLKYTIDYQGKVIATKVIKSLGYGCDEEAVRVVQLLKFKVPKNRGVRVKFGKDIQIHFRLPKEEKLSPQPTTQINYVITPTSKPKESSQKEQQGGGYTIRIDY
ncbi:MAG: energy transducer TonB [Bacteroidota bacterium]